MQLKHTTNTKGRHMAKGASDTENRQAEENFDLFGSFRFKVDAKGRVALPAKFRKVLPRDLIVSLELEDKCLYVFDVSSFNEWVEDLFEDKFG